MSLEFKSGRRIALLASGRHSVIRVLALALVGLLCAVSCSNDGDTNPGPVVVDMFGYLDFPAGEAVSPQDITVGFGDYEVAPDSEGTFIISGNEGAPGLAMACTEDSIILLMAIVPDPQGELAFGLDAASTALSLAFLSPFVCVDDPDDAEEVLGVLEGLPEFDDLEDLLDEKLGVDPEALGKEDPEIDAALSDVVQAYINSYPPAMARNYPSAGMYVDRRPESGGSAGSAGAPAPRRNPRSWSTRATRSAGIISPTSRTTASTSPTPAAAGLTA